MRGQETREGCNTKNTWYLVRQVITSDKYSSSVYNSTYRNGGTEEEGKASIVHRHHPFREKRCFRKTKSRKFEFLVWHESVPLVFGVETVLWHTAAKKGGKWYRGVVEAAECFMTR